MTVVRHCRHCWGDCSGDCLRDDTGTCIHNEHIKMMRRTRVGRRLLSPAWLRMRFRGHYRARS
jgi:hypothetical protein